MKIQDLKLKKGGTFKLGGVTFIVEDINNNGRPRSAKNSISGYLMLCGEGVTNNTCLWDLEVTDVVDSREERGMIYKVLNDEDFPDPEFCLLVHKNGTTTKCQKTKYYDSVKELKEKHQGEITQVLHPEFLSPIRPGGLTVTKTDSIPPNPLDLLEEVK